MNATLREAEIRYSLCSNKFVCAKNKQQEQWRLWSRRRGCLLRHSSSQEIPCLLSNPKVHYRGHSNSPLDTRLSQMNLIHISTSYFFKIHFIITLPSTPKSLKMVYCLTFPY